MRPHSSHSAKAGTVDWRKFQNDHLFFHSKKFSLKVKGKVYTSCIRSCLIYGTSSKTWPLKAEHKAKLNRNEMRIITWVWGFQKHNLIKLNGSSRA